MKRNNKTDGLSQSNENAGTGLLETMIACTIIFICGAAVLMMASVAFSTTENEGHLLARTVEYSQDKVEQLLALAYCDASTDTTQLPSQPSGGTGLAGCPVPVASPATGTGIGGSSDPSNAVSGYVDYLDATGTLVTGVNGALPATWFYVRVWQISAGPGGVTQTKQITVTTRVKNAAAGALPQSSVSVLKTYPF